MKVVKRLLTKIKTITIDGVRNYGDRAMEVFLNAQQQKIVDAEVKSIVGHISAHHPEFMSPTVEGRLVMTEGAIELDHANLAYYKPSFREQGIALHNATPLLQEAGFNMVLQFTNSFLPVKVYKQVHLGRGRHCRMMKPAI